MQKGAQGNTDYCKDMVGEGGANSKECTGMDRLSMVGACSKDVVQAQNGELISAPSTGRACWAVTMPSLKPKMAAKPSESSQENVTIAAIAGNSTQHMSVLLIATPVVTMTY